MTSIRSLLRVVGFLAALTIAADTVWAFEPPVPRLVRFSGVIQGVRGPVDLELALVCGRSRRSRPVDGISDGDL